MSVFCVSQCKPSDHDCRLGTEALIRDVDSVRPIEKDYGIINRLLVKLTAKKNNEMLIFTTCLDGAVTIHSPTLHSYTSRYGTSLHICLCIIAAKTIVDMRGKPRKSSSGGSGGDLEQPRSRDDDNCDDQSRARAASVWLRPLHKT